MTADISEIIQIKLYFDDRKSFSFDSINNFSIFGIKTERIDLDYMVATGFARSYIYGVLETFVNDAEYLGTWVDMNKSTTYLVRRRIGEHGDIPFLVLLY